MAQRSGELSESFNIGEGVRQGCVMSPWLFNIYMDGCMREMNEEEREDLRIISGRRKHLEISAQVL